MICTFCVKARFTVAALGFFLDSGAYARWALIRFHWEVESKVGMRHTFGGYGAGFLYR